LNAYQLEIFDRWGELIWETDVVSKGWNGRYKENKDVQIGTYTWKIQYVDNVSVTRVILGHVNVIR
jgi:gliding motility-associated-like protein